MNHQLLEKLSAFLDNELLPLERQQVEERVQRDPAVRAELEALRQVSALFDQAPLPLLAPPPDMHTRIMQRLRAETQASGHSPAPIPSRRWVGIVFSPYLLAGAALAGMLGTMVYVDLHQPNANRRPAGISVPVETMPAAGRNGNSPAPAVPKKKFGSAAPAEIQGGLGAGSKSAPAPKLSGEVYSVGQGRAQKQGGVAGKASGAKTLPVQPVLSRRESEFNLESASGWDQNRLRASAASTSKIQPDEILTLAQRHHLNPGLLMTAMRDLPERSPYELAVAIRTSLNATYGQSSRQRLEQILKDLKGNAAWLKKWEAGMK